MKKMSATINRHYLSMLLLAVIMVFSSFWGDVKPTLFLIGDSTVKNGKGKGDSGLWGWGNFMSEQFDTNKINIENRALGGTSSRTFQTKGLWDSVLVKIKAGDFVMIQFGHNDGSPLDDTARARGTIKGIGNESKEIFNPITKKQEVVYTYGWYMRKFIKDINAKGATAIICSPVPRDPVKNGIIVPANDNYAVWAEEVAQAEKVAFVNLNKIIKDKYVQLTAEQVKTLFTEKDHTHTSEEGAKFNAVSVSEGLRNLKECPLAAYLK